MNYDPFDLSRYLTNSFIARCGGTLAEKGGLPRDQYPPFRLEVTKLESIFG